MKRRFFILSLLCVLFVSFIAVDMVVADTAETKTVTFINRHRGAVLLAVRYKDAQYGWVTEGWHIFHSNTTNKINFNSNNKIFYLYADGQNKEWEGQGSSTDRTYGVGRIGAKFRYVGSDDSRSIREVDFFQVNFSGNSGVFVFAD